MSLNNKNPEEYPEYNNSNQNYSAPHPPYQQNSTPEPFRQQAPDLRKSDPYATNDSNDSSYTSYPNQPPAYGQPQQRTPYAPQQPPQQPYYGPQQSYYGQAPQYDQQQSNPFALVGLITAFFIPLVGLIFSILGLVKSKKVNKGFGLSVAGIIVSVLSGIIGLVVFASVAEYESSYTINDKTVTHNSNDEESSDKNSVTIGNEEKISLINGGTATISFPDETWEQTSTNEGYYNSADSSVMMIFMSDSTEGADATSSETVWNDYVDRFIGGFIETSGTGAETSRTPMAEDQFGNTYSIINFSENSTESLVVIKVNEDGTILLGTAVSVMDSGSGDYDDAEEILTSLH